MLPDPVLILSDGSTYAGLLLACFMGSGLALVAVFMAGSVSIREVRIGIYAFALLASLGGWFGPAIDLNQYEWFEWYDGLLVPLRVLITPEYYRSIAGIMLLVGPALVMLGSVALSAMKLFGAVLSTTADPNPHGDETGIAPLLESSQERQDTCSTARSN